MALAENLVGSSARETAAVAERVLIYGMNYAPEPTGVGRYTGEIGSYLAKQRVEVEVVTAVPHYPGWGVRSNYRNRYSVEHLEGTRIVRCPLLLKTDMRGLWRVLAPLSFALTSCPVVIWRILTTRPDTVLCVEPTLFAAPAAILASKIIGARTVLHVQDLEIDAAFAVGHIRGRILQKFASVFERIVLRAFDRIVTISSRMRERIVSKGVIPQRVNLVRNWVDVANIRPLNISSAYRSELGFSDEHFVVLYAGNIGPKQALPIVLEAAEQLSVNSKIRFVIAGEGPDKSRLMALYGHLSHVKFLSVQPEERLCDLLNLADVHLLPQDRGAADLVLPSKLGGMLASGKPSIVMADPGTELYEFLRGAVQLVPAGDVYALCEAVMAVLAGTAADTADRQRQVVSALTSEVSLGQLFHILARAL